MGSLHLLLDNEDFDISQMKTLLENDSFSINDKNGLGETPLVRVLKSENCTVDIVELFLNYGADPNSKDKLGSSALMIAIRYRKEKNILRMLLQKGADVSRTTHFEVFYQNSLTEYLYQYNDDCLLEMVQHFIQSGVNVNRTNNLGQTVLVTALCCCNDKEILRAILAAGANPNMHDGLGRYPLCRALRSSHSANVIKMMLNAGSSLNGCMVHNSVLHCATDDPALCLKEDVLQLLLREGADVTRVNRSGEALMCFAIPRTERVCDIKLLMEAGASLTVCSEHSSPLLCATTVQEAPLSEEKVKFLVGETACVEVKNKEGLSPLELAVKNCNYETEAITMLFNLQTSNIEWAIRNENILHLALSNSFCKVSALKFLINNGAQLDKINPSGNYLMHIAIAANLDSKLSIIQYLLKLGTPLNVENASGETPLELALKERSDPSILQLLLAAGAQVNRPLLDIWQKSAKHGTLLWRYSLEGLNLILKYSFLQNPDYDIGSLIQGHIHYEALVEFSAKCLSEVRRMESKTMEDGRSFRKFLNDLYLPREVTDEHNLQVNYWHFNQLLGILVTDDFPSFSDVILTKIGRKIMKTKLKELQVYAVKPAGNGKVILDNDSVCTIAKFLSDDDLLRLILAYYDDDSMQ